MNHPDSPSMSGKLNRAMNFLAFVLKSGMSQRIGYCLRNQDCNRVLIIKVLFKEKRSKMCMLNYVINQNQISKGFPVNYLLNETISK